MNDKDLSLNQRRVLALFDGENHVSTNDVVNMLGLARPTAKQILMRLKEHDLLESRGLGRGAFYTIKQESDILDTKGDKMVIVYRGIEAFQAMFDRLSRTLKRGDFYWSFAFKDEYHSKEVGDLLMRFHSEIAKNGVEDRAIASKEVESVLRKNYANVPGLKLRFTDMNIPIGTIILKDSVINLVWGAKPIAIVIKVPAIHAQYYRSFHSAWGEIGEQGNRPNSSIEKPGNTPLVPIKNFLGIRSLWMKNEVQNPTHTFKDRLAYEMIRPMVEEYISGTTPSPKTFASISYGNTAKSMGTYVSFLNELVGKKVAKAIAFVPPSLEKKTFGPDTEGRTMSAGNIVKELKKDCTILPIDLDKKIYLSNDLKELALENSAVLGEFIDITEGLDRPAYVNIVIEAVEQQLKYSPDYIIVPFGAGILCNEIIDYINDHKLHTKVIPVSSGNPDTIAVMLYGPIWVDTKSLAKNKWGWTRHENTDKKGRKREPYKVYHVADEELLTAMKELKKRGFHAEPSGASGFALLPLLSQIEPAFNPQKHSVVVINTGDSFLNYD